MDGLSPSNSGVALAPEEHPTIIDVWQEMEKLVETGTYLVALLRAIGSSSLSGKVRAIGVSNFSVKTLEILLPHCKIIPAVNQIEMHPCLPNIPVKKLCDARGILLTAYSPFGQSIVICIQ